MTMLDFANFLSLAKHMSVIFSNAVPIRSIIQVHMADGYSRVLNKPGVCIAQNGPGITNFVTGVAAAFWAHSPVVVITPETGSLTNGLGGFQVIL